MNGSKVSYNRVLTNYKNLSFPTHGVAFDCTRREAGPAAGLQNGAVSPFRNSGRRRLDRSFPE